MSGNTTVPTADPGSIGMAPSQRDVPALVIAYCRAEPWRIGEVFLFPDMGIETFLGRGPGEGREVRAEPCQQRPTGNVRQPPLADPSLSRKFLKLIPKYIGFEPGFDVQFLPRPERRGEMRVNGEPIASCSVMTGDTIEIRGEREGKLLLYCTRRPMHLHTRFADVGTWPPFGGIDEHQVVGESPARWTLRENLIVAAELKIHTLLHGPSGSGKELAAGELHKRSERRDKPFVAVNAAAFTESLIAAELFGNVRDFPNKGMEARRGMFGEANGGTLFLDEIGEMAEWLQTRLLRATNKHGEYMPVGASKPLSCDVWVIAATNRDVYALKFDFAGRLETKVKLPGLNERREDIPLLVQHLGLAVAKKSPRLAAHFVADDPDGRKYVRVDPALIDALLRWTYTTHVRELSMLLGAAIPKSRGTTIALYPELKENLRRQIEERERPAKPEREKTVTRSPEDEEQLLRLICDGRHGSKATAARALGKSRQQIDRLLEKYGITVPEGDGGDEDE